MHAKSSLQNTQKQRKTNIAINYMIANKLDSKFSLYDLSWNLAYLQSYNLWVMGWFWFYTLEFILA